VRCVLSSAPLEKIPARFGWEAQTVRMKNKKTETKTTWLSKHKFRNMVCDYHLYRHRSLIIPNCRTTTKIYFTSINLKMFMTKLVIFFQVRPQLELFFIMAVKTFRQIPPSPLDPLTYCIGILKNSLRSYI
jgi:hypothetical protein